MSSRFSRYELLDYSPFPSFISRETSLFSSNNSLLSTPFSPSFSLDDDLDHLTLDLLHPFDFDGFNPHSHLIHPRRFDRVGLGTDLYLQSLCDRVSALELSFDRLERKGRIGERKYTWKAEIESPYVDGVDRKYKWKAEVRDGKRMGGLEKNFKYTAEIKGKGHMSPTTRTYTFKASNSDSDDYNKWYEVKEKEYKDKKKSKYVGSARAVEIDGGSDHRVFAPRQAYMRRVEKVRGKRKDLSPLDAAVMIQGSFRAHMTRRSKALRYLRELAVAKSKLKQIRALFNNFTYRRHVSVDAEERQRFSEKIIVLLLTVDAIEGSETMIRAAKKLMVNELEAMLDVVDPQAHGKSLATRRRAFDMPDSVIQKDLAAGVAQVVRMLDQEPNGSESFEACL